MDDLITWLRAQLDDDERTAKAVHPAQAGEWRGDEKEGYCGEDFRVVAESGRDVVGPGYEGGGAWGVEVRDHIARHDPARVLREVEAKRRLIDMHQRDTLAIDGGYEFCVKCAMGDSCDDCLDYSSQVWPCSTLRLLALPFSDRPGYREEAWKP